MVVIASLNLLKNIMAKCEKCGVEYAEGTEHKCAEAEVKAQA